MASLSLVVWLACARRFLPVSNGNFRKQKKVQLVINQTGSPDYQKLETEIIESQKTFFEETLPNLLRDTHKAEKSDKEMYAELTRKRKDFLSVSQTMPQSF